VRNASFLGMIHCAKFASHDRRLRLP
jgi:hypothetical protein